MRTWEKVMYEILTGTQPINEILHQALSDLRLSIKEFAKETRISKSTLYKIMSSQKKDVRLSNVKEIISGIRKIQDNVVENGNSIAMIIDRAALESIKKEIEVDGRTFSIKGYPSTNIEEAIIQGVNAERDGVKAIICGPIAAFTLEKLVRIPVIALKLKPEQIQSALSTVVKNIA
ncbi:MAG: transcriptional regulator [Candidatus Omnitrophica bacterium]|nr:transcriptional regulator [Candidatus Omnitrophota bacterium]